MSSGSTHTCPLTHSHTSTRACACACAAHYYSPLLLTTTYYSPGALLTTYLLLTTYYSPLPTRQAHTAFKKGLSSGGMQLAERYTEDAEEEGGEEEARRCCLVINPRRGGRRGGGTPHGKPMCLQEHAEVT